MDLPGDRYPLSDNTFRKIAELLCSSGGLRFEKSSKYLIDTRLASRLIELGLDSFEKYYLHLRYHPDRENELDTAFDLLTTHETYFFREEGQLRAFTMEIVPQFIRTDSNTLRVWCAGCASGEEPYTIAMLFDQYHALNGGHIRLFGSDISQKMIETATAGIYGEASFRSTPDPIRKRYFEKLEDGRYKILDEIKQMVTFLKHNLLEEDRTGLLNEMDVILCRNVLIYLGAEARNRILEMFYEKLRPRGYLLLGHSESLIAFHTRFRLRHLQNDMVYQK